MTLTSDADFILKWTEDLKNEVEALDFDVDDIRKEFFGLIYDYAYCYYRDFQSIIVSDFLNKGQIKFDIAVNDYKAHIGRIAVIAKSDLQKESHRNSLIRSLSVGAWSSFELCVTTFCEAICNSAELEKLLEYHYREVVKEIKKCKLSNIEDEKLRKVTIKGHLTHVPIIRKTDFLFKKAKNYQRDINKDKEFLLFFGKLRNTLHTNFIYSGKDYEYKFGNAHFMFNDNKIVKWRDPFKPSPKLHFYLVQELKEIWNELIKSIEYTELIPYPDIDK